MKNKLKKLKQKMNNDARFYDDDLVCSAYVGDKFKSAYLESVAKSELRSICEYIKDIEVILKELEDEKFNKN